MRVALFIVLYIEQTNVLNVIYNTKHIARSHSVHTLGARRSRNINGTARCLCGCVFGSVGWLCVSCASVLCVVSVDNHTRGRGGRGGGSREGGMGGCGECGGRVVMVGWW